MKSKRREIPSEIPTPQNSGNPNKFEIHKIQETHKFSGNIEVRWSKILSDSEALKKWQYLINTVGEEATRIFVKNAEEDFVFISSRYAHNHDLFTVMTDWRILRRMKFLSDKWVNTLNINARQYWKPRQVKVWETLSTMLISTAITKTPNWSPMRPKPWTYYRYEVTPLGENCQHRDLNEC